MQRLFCLCACLLAATAAAPHGFAVGASPQDSFSLIPNASSKGDIDEVEDDLLADPSAELNRDVSADVAAVPALDTRSQHQFEVSIGLGRLKPWQSFGGEFGTLVEPDTVYGLYVGGGSFDIYGTRVATQSYDMAMDARGAGGYARYHFHKFDLLAVEASCGLSTWNGHIAPRGSDDQLLDQSQKLTDSFHAFGLTAGIGGNLNWVWENGFFIDWTIAGLQLAKVLRKDFSRDNGAVNAAVTKAIEGPRIYGIVDLKLGFYF